MIRARHREPSAAALASFLVACAAQGERADVPVEPAAISAPYFPPPYRVGTLAVPAARQEEGAQVSSRLRSALADGGTAGLGELIVSPWPALNVAMERLAKAKERPPPSVTLEPLYPTPSGYIAQLEMWVGGNYIARTVYVGPSASGAWQVHGDTPGAELGTATAPSLSGTIWIDPRAAWIEADIELELAEAREYVVLDLMTYTNATPGVRVRSVEVDGSAAAFVTAPGKLVVQLGEGREPGVRVRYAGNVTRHQGGDFVHEDDVVLRGEADWLPTVRNHAGRFNLHVRMPRGYTAFGQGEAAAPEDLPNGWVEWSWIMPTSNGFTLYAAPEYVTREVDFAGARLIVAVWPSSAGAIGNIVGPLQELKGRFDMLGRYPFRSANIVQTGFPGGYGALSNLTLGRDIEGLPRDEMLPFLAHELAHGWFPGTAVVPAGAGTWGEPMAHYVMTKVVDPALALREREACARKYAAVPAAADKPIRSVTGKITDWSVTEGVNYCKGLLVLTALEDRVGETAMQRFLRTVYTERAGKVTTWDTLLDLARSSLGSGEGAWLAGQIGHAGAPQVRLENVGRKGATVTGRVKQTGGDAESVELGVFNDAGDLMRVVSLPLTAETTAFSIAADGAAAVVVDPRFRRPRRWDVAASDVSAGLRAPLR